MFFAGRLPRPPWETRGRVDSLVKQMDRMYLANYGDRFRFSTLQSRCAAFVDLWDRGLGAREEGRPGPFAHHRPAQTSKRSSDRILHVATFTDPVYEFDKLRDLYHSLTEARTEAGEGGVPFHRFAELVKNQVLTMKQRGSPEVAFRVAMKDGKVAFTVRGLNGSRRDGRGNV